MVKGQTRSGQAIVNPLFIGGLTFSGVLAYPDCAARWRNALYQMNIGPSVFKNSDGHCVFLVRGAAMVYDPRFPNFQLSFGWSDQATCQECGVQFVTAFLPHWFVETYQKTNFYSIRFCSQGCATNGLEKRDREDENRQNQRKQWG